MVVTLNEREQKLLQVAWQCMDVQPKIDYEKLAQLSGLGTKGSATTAWCVLKKKLTTGGEALVAGSPARVTTPKAATPRKRKIGAGTPQSSKRSKTSLIEDSHHDDDDDDDDDEEIEMSQVEKRGKKAQAAAVKVEDTAAVVDHSIYGQAVTGNSIKTLGGEQTRIKQEGGVDESPAFLQGLAEAAAGAI